MWKRDEAPKPGPGGSQPAQGPSAGGAHAPAAETARSQAVTNSDPFRGLEKNVNIGKSVIIKGELNGSEDLTIEGAVDGKIELRQNILTIGPNGKIKAQIFAKSVIILGEVTGNVTASDKVDIRDNGSVDGDITAPRVAISEGAHFRGSIDMQRAGAPGAAAKPGEPKEARAEQKPAAPAAPAGQPAPVAASR